MITSWNYKNDFVKLSFWMISTRQILTSVDHAGRSRDIKSYGNVFDAGLAQVENVSISVKSQLRNALAQG